MSTVEGKTLTKKKALKDLLSEGSEDFMSITSVHTTAHGSTFLAGGCEYLILTDKEAIARVDCIIRDTVENFSTEFIKLFVNLSESVIEEIKTYDNAREVLTEAIEEWDCEEGGCGMCNFIDKAIDTVGRGHLLSPYHGGEKEVGNYFIYKIN